MNDEVIVVSMGTNQLTQNVRKTKVKLKMRKSTKVFDNRENKKFLGKCYDHGRKLQFRMQKTC